MIAYPATLSAVLGTYGGTFDSVKIALAIARPFRV